MIEPMSRPPAPAAWRRHPEKLPDDLCADAPADHARDGVADSSQIELLQQRSSDVSTDAAGDQLNDQPNHPTPHDYIPLASRFRDSNGRMQTALLSTVLTQYCAALIPLCTIARRALRSARLLVPALSTGIVSAGTISAVPRRVVEPGPWPQMKVRSSPNGSSFSVMRADQRGVVAIGKIGAADRALEQHVAHQRKPRRAGLQTPHARGVPRTMQHIETMLAECHAVALAQPAVRRDIAHREAVAAALRCQPRSRNSSRSSGPSIGTPPWCQRAVAALLQLRRAAGVVQMAMRQPDALDRRAGLSMAARMRSTSPPGSTTTALLAVVIPQDRAVLLERSPAGPRRSTCPST